mgnify:CR=1 FL=1
MATTVSPAVSNSIGLASTYLAVTLTRSMLEPKFLGRHLGLDPLVTLVSLYVGFQLWGIPGLLLSPMAAVILKELFQKPTES